MPVQVGMHVISVVYSYWVWYASKQPSGHSEGLVGLLYNNMQSFFVLHVLNHCIPLIPFVVFSQGNASVPC